MKEILLTQGKTALVDDCDFETLNQHRWCATKRRHTYYAIRNVRFNGKWTMIYLHRAVLGLTDPKVSVDHINGYGLDNRRENLRIATNAQNQANQRPQVGCTSTWRGMCFDKSYGKWKAQIGNGTSSKYLGRYHRELLAAHRYDRAAREQFKEFAKPKFGEGSFVTVDLTFFEDGTVQASNLRVSEPSRVMIPPDGQLQLGLKVEHQELAA